MLTEIGGRDHADRNVIVGTRGVHVSGNLNFVYNNYIGTDRRGSVGLGVVDPTSIGIFVNSDSNVFESNVIGGYDTAVRLLTDNSGNQFLSNKIGTDRTGSTPIPNGVGLQIGGSGITTQVTIGGSASDANTIAYNTEQGILLTDANNVEIAHNAIHNNRVGIDTTSVSYTHLTLPTIYSV